GSGGNSDLWQYEFARGVRSRFTFDGGNAGAWAPDGGHIAFHKLSPMGLFLKDSGGAGGETRLTNPTEVEFVNDWAPHGRSLLYSMVSRENQYDLWLVPLTSDRKPIPFLQTPFLELQGQFSPDNKWISYTSNESGRDEVYVQSFPIGKSKFQISTN